VCERGVVRASVRGAAGADDGVTGVTGVTGVAERAPAAAQPAASTALRGRNQARAMAKTTEGNGIREREAREGDAGDACSIYNTSREGYRDLLAPLAEA
jgi:hypothetical protein